jgi:transcriptional regulator of NAD metabolism
VDRLEGTTEHRIEGDVTKAIEVLSNRLSLTNDEQSSVLKHLIEGGDLTHYGLINAVTRTAEDAKSYDRATELEMAGAIVLDLNPTEWRELALAA